MICPVILSLPDRLPSLIKLEVDREVTKDNLDCFVYWMQWHAKAGSVILSDAIHHNVRMRVERRWINENFTVTYLSESVNLITWSVPEGIFKELAQKARIAEDIE